MRVAQKGLLVVGIPLLFQLIFVTLLLLLFTQLKNDLLEETKARDGIATAYSLMMCMTDANLAAIGCAATGDHRFEAAFDREISKIYKLTEKIRDLSQGHPEQIKQVNDYATASKRLDSLYKTYLRNPALITTSLSGAAQEDRREGSLASTSTRLGRALKLYIADVETLADQKLQSIRSARNVIQIVLTGGLFLDVMLAAGMALFLSQGFIKRLDLVFDNVDKLRRRKHLPPQLTGDDEIEEVDAALHRTANALMEAEKGKMEAIQVIHGQLQRPLAETHSILNSIADDIPNISEKAQKRIDMATTNLDRLLLLLTDLVNSGSSPSTFSLRKTKITLADLIRQGTLLCEPMAKQNGITISIEPCPDLTFDGDFDLLCQILINLITNAIKYSPRESVVTIAGIPVDQQIEIRVSDKGRGIPKELQEDIFKLFQQVETTDGTKKGGTGLGLAICKSIATEHGGTMGVESVLNEGSSFWLRIPVAHAFPESEAHPRPPFRVSIRSKILSLIVRPLGITTVLVACLSTAVHVLNDQIEAQINAQQITAEVNKIVITGVNLLRLTLLEVRNEKQSEIASQLRISQEAHLEKLKKLSAHRTAVTPLVAQMQVSMAEVMAITKTSVDPSKRFSAVAQSQLIDTSRIAEFKRSSVGARQYGRRIIALSTNEERRNQNSVLVLYSWIMMTTPLAVLAAIFLTIWSSTQFSRQITNRLTNLRRNAELLARGPLRSRAETGMDELAQLDQFFHHVSDRMEELDEFRKHVVGVISHEMKTPLQNVFGVVALLPRLVGAENQTAAFQLNVAIAEYQLRRVIRLVHDLLTVEKIHSGTFNLNIQPTTLGATCENAVLLACDPRSEEGAVSMEECPDTSVKLDGERVASVLATIIKNVLDEGSSVTLRAHVNERLAQFVIESQIPRRRVNERFLEQFPDLTSSRFSSITGSIVKEHGGVISIEGSPEEPATFRLELSLAN
ncbi:MAG: HAMP domain-containing histidine kinase [Candidatus Obscuribacterales bacterium]|nr:HAMP domain-containing histidine kinase [Candidatus Obscuribacterales bacterium]